MKQLCALVLILGFSLTVSGQENRERGSGSNEIKFNGAYVIENYLEFGYERAFKNNTALGLTAGFAFDESQVFDLALLPYYRTYFGKKKAAGFFLEVHGTVYQKEEFVATWPFVYVATGQHFIGAGAGVGFGVKLLSQSNWIGELNLGAGRNFFNTDSIAKGYPRVGITLGKGF